MSGVVTAGGLQVKKMIFDDMIACGKAAKLRSFELPKKIAFETTVTPLSTTAVSRVHSRVVGQMALAVAVSVAIGW